MWSIGISIIIDAVQYNFNLFCLEIHYTPTVYYSIAIFIKKKYS